ncbi:MULTISPECIES: hypothetical protein [unclassified Saccharibacter]|uniref:structural cement protein Gp24 n=1 Tax=unclassified Saccharibacter TaxID=2648722 RepID=UPI0013265CF7|nr:MULTISPECIES: hypothetical protein [unclassified Saccharibacter]MXV35748.1 hypothetical protein [Saccharibacter sp. EH611]MXV58426.1 hypothetical protein [Saccharibacter sp. EH70]
MPTEFQRTVNYTWPQGYAGAIASANPRRSVISPEAGFRVGSSGLVIAAFAWVNQDGMTVSNTGSGKPTGFVHRDQQGLTTQYLQGATMSIPAGFAVTLSSGGDYWALSQTDATVGQSVYASTKDGTLQTAAPGSAPQNTVDTGWIVTQGAPAGTEIIITGPITA